MTKRRKVVFKKDVIVIDDSSSSDDDVVVIGIKKNARKKKRDEQPQTASKDASPFPIESVIIQTAAGPSTQEDPSNDLFDNIFLPDSAIPSYINEKKNTVINGRKIRSGDSSDSDKSDCYGNLVEHLEPQLENVQTDPSSQMPLPKDSALLAPQEPVVATVKETEETENPLEEHSESQAGTFFPATEVLSMLTNFVSSLKCPELEGVKQKIEEKLKLPNIATKVCEDTLMVKALEIIQLMAETHNYTPDESVGFHGMRWTVKNTLLAIGTAVSEQNFQSDTVEKSQEKLMNALQLLNASNDSKRVNKVKLAHAVSCAVELVVAEDE